MYVNKSTFRSLSLSLLCFSWSCLTEGKREWTLKPPHSIWQTEFSEYKTTTRGYFNFPCGCSRCVHYLPFKEVFSHFILSRAAGSSPGMSSVSISSFCSSVSISLGLGWKVITGEGLGYPEPRHRQHQVLQKHFHHKLWAFPPFRSCSQAPMAQALSWLVLFWSLRSFLRGEWVTFLQENFIFGLFCWFFLAF